MIEVKVYIYDSANEANGYRGADYSQYVLEASTFRDNLDDTLDTHELTLAGLSFREEFAPSTKFIIDLAQNGIVWKTLNILVDNDSVSQPIISKDNYFNHAITFSECGIDAQQRGVDNIAVTYKLQDVTLDVVPSYSTDDTVNVAKEGIAVGGYDVPFGYSETTKGFWQYKTCFTSHSFQWEMPSWWGGSWDTWNNIKQNEVVGAGQSSKTITLDVPSLKCMGGVNGASGYATNGYCSVDLIVQRKPIGSGVYSEISRIQFNPSMEKAQEATWSYDDRINNESVVYPISDNERTYGYIESGFTYYTGTGRFYGIGSTVASLDSSTSRTATISVDKNYTYKISVLPHFFEFSRFVNDLGYSLYPAYKSQASLERSTFSEDVVKNESIYINNGNVVVELEFNVFEADEYGEIIFTSAPPANAYDLFNKAVLATENFRKVNGTPCDLTPSPYYLDTDNARELQNTQIVENFYQQKNLWEILMEVGKYIHARPVVRFGADDKFKVDWKRYGKTTQNEDSSNHISVYNSRFVSEYISSLSSYVDNMVQLGGTITEVVAPQSSSEDFLVYNDVAEIKVTKPITEIVGFYATNSSGTTQDLLNLSSPTGHSGVVLGAVYEYNVYKLLSVDKLVYPNKGYALYYSLGDNVIKGLTYRLPTPSTGDIQNDYAIKNILALAFGISDTGRANIKVNDYTFKIVYRTKDTMRSDQTRPDLRKYLLASKYDNVPQHYQFNNQQDILVDSVKFGINTFGKLIRTGNTTYSVVEWNNSLSALKNAGDLYNIFGNLYYVSKATHTIFPDHIESEIEYTKDFNRLAQIIGIPSEPRFYEISEQSQIRREKSFNSYLILGDIDDISQNEPIKSYINGTQGFGYVNQLLFKSAVSFPKYAYTAFKSDEDKPSPNGKDHLVKTFLPISAYSSSNTMTLEWDTEDNFSAGNQVGAEVTISGATEDEAYRTLLPYKYPDVYGRTDLVDFAILSDYTFADQDAIRALPASPISNVDDNFSNMVFRTPSADINSHAEGEVLLKDNREAISINANTQLIDNSDRFVISSYVWQPNKGTVKLGLLSEEVNKMSPSTIGTNNFVEGAEGLDVSTSIYANYRDVEINGSASLSNGETARINFVDYSSSTSILPSGITVEGGRIKLENANTYQMSAFKLYLVRNVGHLTSRATVKIVLEDAEGNLVQTISQISNTLLTGLLFNQKTITTTEANLYLAFYITCTSSLISFDGTLAGNITQISIGYPQTAIDIGISGAINSAGLTEAQKTATKAVVVYTTDIVVGNTVTSGAHYFIVAKNVGGLENTAKFTDWAIWTPAKDMFLHQ